ncbi:MAG: caspase family protein [Gammaproteobacteria bacterium]|nr:caspase family protein [Gammaproteobacteria bacterium]
MKIKFILGIVLGMFSTATLATNEVAELQRFGLFVGANDGGEKRVKLKYAVDDARSVSNVFKELGALGEANRILLPNPDVQSLDHAFNVLSSRLSESQARRKEVIFYYSGHSDDQGLLIKDGQYTFKALREKIAAISSDVKIAILDSCEADAFMRTKGGDRAAPFMFDTSNNVKGQVFLASSSENEAAQESEKIQGSFFTHYLVSAMRGAGDVSEDKKVTLNEAYQFAYQETLARTESSRAGAQHAAYDMQLAGAGDLVLTDLRESMSVLNLGDDVRGRVFIRDAEDRLVVELSKQAGKALSIGLEPAVYRILVADQEELFGTKVSLGLRQTRHLAKEDMQEFERANVVAKGGILSKDEYPGKVYVAFGSHSRPMSMWSEVDRQNYHYKLLYLGFNAAVHWQYHPDARLVLDLYGLASKGMFLGASLDFQYDFVSFYQNKFRIYFGVGTYYDVLYKFWDDEWEVPSAQASYQKYNSNFNLKIPLGIRFQDKRFGFELTTHFKPDYTSDNLDSNAEGMPVVARLLYQFQ